jgi:hypothetical protein
MDGDAIKFEPAVRANTAIVLALCGASGSGKTKSALELAVGLAGETGKILLIDTEGKRALHYADDYKFYHHSWTPPFSPKALGTLLHAGEAQGFSVIIVDSTSDEHEGEGGLCDMAEAEYEKQRDGTKNSAAAWARPKAEHKHEIVRWLRQARCHVIFCCRADEKVRFEKVEKNGRTTTVVVPIGWQPISEKRLLYDVTTSLLFTPDHPGEPQPIKLYDKHTPFFPAGTKVNRAAGEALARWAAGGVPPAAPVPETSFAEDVIMALENDGRTEAVKGNGALNAWYKGLNKSEKGVVTEKFGPMLREIARKADLAVTG